MATNLLSPEELSALAEGVNDGTIPVDTGYNTAARVRKHDLASEDSSLGVNVASVDMINERFVRLFRLGLLEMLRSSPRVTPTRVKIMRFGEYLQDLKAPLSVNVVRMNPLRGYSMVVIDPVVVFSSLDSFFGGFGVGVGQLPAGRLFTPTETRIINMILDVFFRSLKEAWSPLMDIEFELVSSEINPQFAQIADENDLVIVSRFVADLGRDVSGNIDLVYPYNALKPIRDLLRSRVQTGDGDDVSDKEWSAELQSAAVDAELEVTVELAQIETTLSKFEALSEGDIVYFSKGEHARLYVNSVPVFDADVGANGSQMAARIIKPLTPIK